MVLLLLNFQLFTRKFVTLCSQQKKFLRIYLIHHLKTFLHVFQGAISSNKDIITAVKSLKKLCICNIYFFIQTGRIEISVIIDIVDFSDLLCNFTSTCRQFLIEKPVVNWCLASWYLSHYNYEFGIIFLWNFYKHIKFT